MFEQIGAHIDGIIMLCAGVWGFYYSKNTKLQANYKKILKISSIILIPIGMLFTVKPFFDKQSKNINYQKSIQEANKLKAGTYVDETLRIDSITLGHHNELIYTYSFVNIKSTETDDDLKETLKAEIITNMQDKPQMNEFLKNGISKIIFRYFGSDSILITEIIIDQSNIK